MEEESLLITLEAKTENAKRDTVFNVFILPHLSENSKCMTKHIMDNILLIPFETQ